MVPRLAKFVLFKHRGRVVREISFKEPNVVKIGHFPAYDYFNDGSMYLLDSPGHCVGHLCALVRTSTSPDTFVFMGGDAAHHCGEFRPSQYVPLPDTITLYQHGRHAPFCPASWYEDLQISRHRDPKGPLWQPSFGQNMEEVMTTIGHMQECDGDDNVFVILAHDASVRSPNVPTFPDSINDWKSRGLGTELKWSWIGEILSTMESNGEKVPRV
jgi:glyoxylase-like metal-dependent hydrolase (beta-lactamase superfamily II)